MATAKPKTIAELEAQKKAIKDAAAAEVAAIRKTTAEKVAALKASERRLRALDIREQKKRENHAKIVVGVAMIHQCQTSDASAAKFKALLEEFYADSPERLKASSDSPSPSKNPLATQNRIEKMSGVVDAQGGAFALGFVLLLHSPE
jgi:hypothetical protein